MLGAAIRVFRTGFIVMSGVGLLAGCGVVPGLNAFTKGDLAFDTAKIFSKKRVAIETGGMPNFHAKEPTTGMMVGGMAGQIAAGHVGNDIIEANAVPNPSQQVGNAIIASMASRGMRPAPSSLASDLVIEISAYEWTIAKFAQDPNRYFIVYSAVARIKDPMTEEVLGQTSCKKVITDTQAAAAPTYDEMMANGAARLKAEMQQITKRCADQIVSKALR